MMDTSIFRQEPARNLRWHERSPYAFALGCSVTAFGVTILFYSVFQYAPRLLLYCAVLAASRIGGAGPGMMTALVTSAFSSVLVGPATADEEHLLEGWAALGGYLSASLLAVGIISQLRNRAQILREKDEQLNDFMEHASVGLQWLAINGTILWTNRAAREILGCTDVNICRGRKFQDFCADAEAARDFARRLQADEKVKNLELQLKIPGGEQRLVMIDANVFWRDGRFVHARCFLRDITLRRNAEDALAEKHNLLRTLIDALPDAVYTKDRESRFLISNTANARLLGAESTEQVLHRTVGDFCPRAIAAPFLADDSEVFEQGRPIFDREEQFLAPDGTERTLLTTKLPLRDGAGNVTGLVGISRDVTDRKSADAAMRESEERFRVLFEHSPETIVILDPNSTPRPLAIIDCNEVACRQHGYTREELRGQSFGLIDIVTRSEARAEALIRRARTDGIVMMETPHRHKEGHSFLMEVWASFITVQQRELLLCMARDVSERKKAEESIRRANEQLEARVRERTSQLEQANRELEAFSYSISHDLRAPVRAIRGFAQIIHEDHGVLLNAEAARLFRFIEESASRMDELIDDLLAFSRINAHELSRGPIDMRGLAESVVAELNSGHAMPPATVQLSDLPSTVGDRSLLRQVFVNLVGNALKFSRNSASPTIEIGASTGADHITYYVRDNGVGFNMKYAQKLFQVFQRLHNPEQFEGTGVGLAIVQRIIQRHGGRVWAESEPNAGATFFLSLPALKPGGPGLPDGSREEPATLLSPAAP